MGCIQISGNYIGHTHMERKLIQFQLAIWQKTNGALFGLQKISRPLWRDFATLFSSAGLASKIMYACLSAILQLVIKNLWFSVIFSLVRWKHLGQSLSERQRSENSLLFFAACCLFVCHSVDNLTFWEIYFSL